MINWKIKLSVFILFTFVSASIYSQQIINASGGNASGSRGSATYSIGQVAYQTHTGTNGSVAEGVQQPYEISVVSAVKETTGINLSVTAYPNPTTDNLTLSIDEFALSNVSYQLYDINGKVLHNKRITSDKTSIAMGDLMPATYFIKVTQDNKEVKTFKIIKQ